MTKSARSYFQRGQAKQQLEDMDGALADFDAAIKHGLQDPDLHTYYNSRGALKQKRDDAEGAQKDFDEAVKLAPPPPPRRGLAP